MLQNGATDRAVGVGKGQSQRQSQSQSQLQRLNHREHRGTGKTLAREYQYAVHEILNHQEHDVSRRTDHEGFWAWLFFVYLGGLGG
jgi:hypothetical protein